MQIRRHSLLHVWLQHLSDRLCQCSKRLAHGAGDTPELIHADRHGRKHRPAVWPVRQQHLGQRMFVLVPAEVWAMLAAAHLAQAFDLPIAQLDNSDH